MLVPWRDPVIRDVVAEARRVHGRYLVPVLAAHTLAVIGYLVWVGLVLWILAGGEA